MGQNIDAYLCNSTICNINENLADLTKYVLIQHKNYTTKAFPPQSGCTALLGRPRDLNHIKRISSESKYSRSYAHPMFDVEIPRITGNFSCGLTHCIHHKHHWGGQYLSYTQHDRIGNLLRMMHPDFRTEWWDNFRTSTSVPEGTIIPEDSWPVLPMSVMKTLIKETGHLHLGGYSPRRAGALTRQELMASVPWWYREIPVISPESYK